MHYNDGVFVTNVADVMMIFKGDNPAAQFESEQQKNGNYFCGQCPLFPPLSPNIVCAMSLPNLLISERISEVRSNETSISKFWRNCVKMYKNLKKDEAVSGTSREKNYFYMYVLN